MTTSFDRAIVAQVVEQPTQSITVIRYSGTHLSVQLGCIIGHGHMHTMGLSITVKSGDLAVIYENQLQTEQGSTSELGQTPLVRREL